MSALTRTVHRSTIRIVTEYFAAICLLVAAVFCWQVVASAISQFSLQMIAPTGGQVSALVGLEAHTTVDASDVFFEVLSEDGTYRKTIPGTHGQTSSMVWVGSWDTYGMPSGPYQIAAHGTSLEDMVAVSQPVQVSLVGDDSATNSPPTTTPFTHLIQPESGATVSGMVEFAAKTNTQPTNLVFIISGRELTADLPIEAASAGTDTWTASWDSRQVPSGSYDVMAHSILPTGVIESPKLSFLVSHVELSIDITKPTEGSTQTGLIKLAAETSQPVSTLKFAVSDASGSVVAAGIVARQSSTANWTSWQADWDSADLLSGVYTVTADVDGRQSVPVYFNLEGVTNDPPPEENTTTDDPPLNDDDSAGADTTPFVTLVEPAYGTELAGDVVLRAVSSTGVEQVKFVLFPAGGSQSLMALNATYNATASGWIANWSTSAVPDGSYSMRPSALASGANLQGEPVSFTIKNGTSEQTPDLAAYISMPQTGALLSGPVDLVAGTTVTADSVTFRITPVTSGLGGDVIELTARPSLERRSWDAVWYTGNVNSGEYQVVALASKGTEVEVSEPVVVEVQRQLGIDVSIVSPAPQTDWSGMIIMGAVTEPPAVSLEFMVRQVDVAGGEYRATGTYDSNAKAWFGELEATSLVPGVYSIEAKAFDAAGNGFPSPKIEINLLSSNPSDDETAPDEAVDVLVVVLHPAAGSKISGYYEFVAETEGPVSDLKFVVEPDADELVSAPDGMTIPAGRDSTGFWTAEWYSRDAPNGPHRLRAEALGDDGTTVFSTWLPFIIENTTDNTEPLLDLLIVSPGNGALITDSTSIALRSTGKPESVAVVIEGTENDYQKQLSAEPVDDRNWLTVWSVAEVPPGEYLLSAVADTSDGSLVSEQVRVKVGAADGTTADTTEETNGPSSDEQTGSGQEELEPSVLNLIAPAPGPVRGAVLLVAESGGPVTDIEFVLRDNSNGNIVMVRRAPFDHSRGQWVSYWHSTNAPSGSYLLHARGKDGLGMMIKSRTVELEVLPPPPPPNEETTDEEPMVVTTTIVQVPDEAVRSIVLEVPVGTAVTRTPDEPADLGDEEQRLNTECAAANVSPQHCPDWLANRYGAPECRAAGIITKSECLAYLAELQGGRLVECSSYDAAECQKFAAEKTQGLLDDEELDELSDQVVPLLGQALILPPDDTAGEGDLPADLARYVPFKGDGQSRVRLHASPGFIQVSEQASRRTVPAVVFIDTDGDGLPDDIERRLGTDPNNADTDGDGYEDGAEIRNGYDPLGSGQLTDPETSSRLALAPVDVALLSGLPLEQPRQSGASSELLSIELMGFDPDAGTAATPEDPVDEGDKLVFAGLAAPGEVVTLFIYSYLPMVLTAEADENGNWTYELDNDLVDGHHEVYVAVTDDTGRIREKSAPLSFFVAEAQAVSDTQFFGLTVLDDSPYMSPEEVSQRESSWYIFGAIGLVVVVLLIGMVIVIRPRRADYRDL